MSALLRPALAALMISAGVAHSVHPEPFARIVPDWLPAHRALVLVSGFCEVAGGVGLLIPPVSRAAAWGLIALFGAVFPATVNMAVRDIPVGGAYHPVLLWLRLPLQAVLVWWAWRLTGGMAAGKHE